MDYLSEKISAFFRQIIVCLGVRDRGHALSFIAILPIVIYDIMTGRKGGAYGELHY